MVACADVMEEAQNRALVYRMLAQVFFAPLSSQQVEKLAVVDWKAVAEAEDVLLADGCNDVYRALRRLNTGTCDELAADYTAVFYGVTTHEGRSAMPYASLFAGNDGQVMGLPRGRMYRLLKSEQMRTARELDVPDDHLSFMLEFMAEQCDRAAQNLQRGDVRGASERFELLRTFVEEEVLGWFPEFQELSMRLVRTRFYRGVLKITGALLSNESGLCTASIEALKSFDANCDDRPEALLEE